MSEIRHSFDAMLNPEVQVAPVVAPTPPKEKGKEVQHYGWGEAPEIERDTTSLAYKQIADEINKSGSIPYSRFMEISLFGPDGYYSKGKVEIGQGRDFITAPEASPLFGAMLGETAVRVWTAMGKPESFQVVEMGAGQGVMADSILSWAKTFHPEFGRAISYYIVEYGTDLIPRQQRNLSRFANVRWINGSAYQLPIGNIRGLIVSNELPDAFPIEVVKLINGQVRQKIVQLDGDKLVEGWGNPTSEVISFIDRYQIPISENEEPINLHSTTLQREQDKALVQGAILTIDYGKSGPVASPKKSASRVYGTPDGKKSKDYIVDNMFVDNDDARLAYITPGQIDITANVNFAPMEKVAQEDGLKLEFSGTQREFLRSEDYESALRKMSDIINQELAKTPRSFRRILSATQAYNNFCEVVMTTMGSFHAQLVTKGLTQESFHVRSDEDHEIKSSSEEFDVALDQLNNNIPRIPVNIGQPHLKVKIESFYRTIFRNHCPDVPQEQETDEKGRLFLPADIFMSYVKISDIDSGEDIVLSRNIEEARPVIERSGYTYDI